ncbi:MAG: hypothetical protein CTY31_12160 [Hyphomicrobium sp.]|nr:MAG: hypothetical protein CTY39_11945 [Hyphomicrobium sp.]PPC98773.1 MAG: hypothetical protein CTY31_12160 [Hyphomicrobium sp.]
MRHDTRKKLNQMLWIERAKKTGIGLAFAAAITLAFSIESLDLMVTHSKVAGTIERIDPLVSKQGTGRALTVGIKLDDGRHVSVIEELSSNPHIGDRVEIAEHRHATGRVTHSFK